LLWKCFVCKQTIVFPDDIRCVIVIGLLQRELKHYNKLFLLADFFWEYLRGLFAQNTQLRDYYLT